MKKKLIFYWYVPPTYWHPIYDLHLRNLYLYKNVFDSIQFIISFDDDSVGVDETIKSIKYFVPNCDIMFFRNNKEQRESAFFYEVIAQNLGNFPEDVALFFAHNKGVQSIYVSPKDLDDWVNSMYYFNLRNVGKIDNFLSEEKTCAIGCGKMTNYSPNEFSGFLTHRWIFAGTFFWIVPNRIAKYVKENNITLKNNTGRYYTEGFLGTIFPENAEEVKCSIPQKNQIENWAKYVYRVASQEEINDYININGKL